MIEIAENNRCCGKCRFFLEWISTGGYCKRSPPTPVGLDEDNSVSYCDPMINKTDWCGEFQPIEKWVIPEGFVILDEKGKEVGKT
jgi:hypothetical protein